MKKMMMIFTLLTISLTARAAYHYDCITKGGKSVVISNFGYGKFSITVDGEAKNAGHSSSSSVFKKYGSDVYSFPGGNFDVISIYAGYGEYLGGGLVRTASITDGTHVTPMRCTVTDTTPGSAPY